MLIDSQTVRCRMPLQETLDTYRYFIGEADKLGLAYITLMRYWPDQDVSYDGAFSSTFYWVRKNLTRGHCDSFAGKKRATVHDVVGSYTPYIKNVKVFLNAGITPAEGETLVSSGQVDGIFIGFQWIPHPDLTERVIHGKPLDNVPDIPHLQWGKDEKGLEVGYTDYPVAVY